MIRSTVERFGRVTLFQEMEKKQGRIKTQRIGFSSETNSKQDKIRALGFTNPKKYWTGFPQMLAPTIFVSK